MSKSFAKKLSIVVLAILAIGICLLGYQVTRSRQYQQQISYAKANLPKEEEKLDQLAKKVKSFYVNDKKQFVKSSVQTVDVKEVRFQVEATKVNAADFQVKPGSLPQSAADLSQQKEKILNDLVDISDKLKVQDQIDQLFTKSVSNWQETAADLSIQKDLKLAEIDSIRDNLVFFSAGSWKNSMEGFLDEATNQVKQQIKIRKKLQSELSYEDYLNLQEEINQVKNPDIKESLQETIDKQAQELGF